MSDVAYVSPVATVSTSVPVTSSSSSSSSQSPPAQASQVVPPPLSPSVSILAPPAPPSSPVASVSASAASPASVDPSSTLFQNIFQQFVSKLQNLSVTKVTPLNVLLVISYAMQLVESSSGVSGASKKELVVQMVDQYVKTVIPDQYTDDERSSILLLIDQTARAGVDIIADAANGNVLPTGCSCTIV